MVERLVNPAEADVAATDDRMPEIRDHKVGLDLRYVGRLVQAYLKADPRVGWALVLFKVALTVGMSFAGLSFQVGLANATNALTQKNAAAAWQGLSLAGTMIGLMFLAMLCSVIAEYTLRMRMRTVYTNSFLGRWLAGNRFFHLERAGGIDHPEQRIQEDIFVYAQTFMTLAPTLLGTLVSVVLYSGTLWKLSPPVSLAFIGLPYTLHGYLPFIAIILGVAMTLLVHWIGDALTKAEITRQRLEAHFRNDMAGVRENAEMVAFEKGQGVEKARLFEIFDLIRQNWRRYTFAQARLGAVLGLPSMLLVVAPMALCAPLILAGRMGLGDMQLVSSSFLMMYMSVSVVATSYREIAILRAAVARMRFFDEALEQPVRSDIRIREVPDATILTKALQLRYPDGQSMVRVGDLKLTRGDRVLVRGPSGVGKSTLLRALAGLWPFGSGEVVLPSSARVCFLPQRGYMPDGTLAALLSYPLAPDPSREDEYRSVLRALHLEALAPSLHRHDQWRKILSPGEQQRVAAARALLSKPDFLFLDESTSALDPHSETILYTLLDEQLPNAAIISVAHRPGVARFHKDVLDLAEGSARWSALPKA